MNLPTDIFREIISYNNPKIETLLSGKDRDKLDKNYLCMYNILPPTRIEYIQTIKKQFNNGDVIMVWRDKNFISYGVIINMLYQPIKNNYRVGKHYQPLYVAKSKSTYKWKLLYTPFTHIPFTHKPFTINKKYEVINLKEYHVEKCLENNDTFMEKTTLYDIVCCIDIDDVDTPKMYKNFVYMGNELFVRYKDFIGRPSLPPSRTYVSTRYKYLQYLETKKIKLNQSKYRIIGGYNSEEEDFTDVEEYLLRIKWINDGIETQLINDAKEEAYSNEMRELERIEYLKFWEKEEKFNFDNWLKHRQIWFNQRRLKPHIKSQKCYYPT